MVLTAYLTTTLLPQCKRLIVIHVLPCVVGESGEPIWCRIRQVAVMTFMHALVMAVRSKHGATSGDPCFGSWPPLCKVKLSYLTCLSGISTKEGVHFLFSSMPMAHILEWIYFVS